MTLLEGVPPPLRGIRIVAIRELPKLVTRVRFPHPACADAQARLRGDLENRLRAALFLRESKGAEEPLNALATVRSKRILRRGGWPTVAQINFTVIKFGIGAKAPIPASR